MEHTMFWTLNRARTSTACSLLLLPLLGLGGTVASAQQSAPEIEWFTSHNGTNEESHGHFILTCDDGGFLQVGETGYVGSNARILVVKTDSTGSLIWKKQFGTGGRNMGNSALEVDDGYLICGMLNRNSAIIKLDKATGSTLFQKTRDNGGADAFEGIAQTANGILAVGYRQAEDPNNTFFVYGQGYLSFLDVDGNYLNGQSVNAYLSQAYRVQPTGSDFIISGGTEDALQYGVIKINASGNVIWNKTFGGSNEDHCFGMDLGPDGSIFLAGHTLSGTANWDTYTMKLDNNGNQIWERKQGNPRGFNPTYIHDETWGIKATCDGGCIIAAGTGDEYPYSDCDGGVCSDQWEAYIVKFDQNGNVDWEETYSSTNGQDWAAEDIDLTSDGGAIIAVDNSQFGFLKIGEIIDCVGDCEGDFNGDGTRDVNDILTAIAAYGNGDAGDIDGDGDTDVSDILALLALFGQEC
tara:strand:- start:51 stop:1448 length:1398 start_codon:yes stop_codon:yes gene_type:complete